MDLDLFNRDPNSINDHLQCQFEDVLAEPDGAHSSVCVWKLSNFCFTCWKAVCYKTATFLCGCCFAACWGCEFASVAFWHVWYVTPSLKKCAINCTIQKRMWRQCIGCVLDPICESCALCFNAFKKN